MIFSVSMLEKLAGSKDVERLPKKSLSGMMMVEARLLVQIQAADEMQNSENNVLHWYGTKLKFEEKGSYQIVTSSGSCSLAIEDMEGGDAVLFLDSFRNVLNEMAAFLVGTNDEKDWKVAEFLALIKNVMNDRHTVNHSFVAQLTKWRQDVLPAVIENYDQLDDDSKEKMARMNHVFCGLHVIHNVMCCSCSSCQTVG